MTRAIVGALAACLTVGAAMTQAAVARETGPRAPAAAPPAAAPEQDGTPTADRRIASAVPAPPARINKVVPRPCGPARAIRCDAPEYDEPLPAWSDETRRRVHEDCRDHMFRSIFPRWDRDQADHITTFYCDCLVDYAEQAMPEREAFAESGLSTYQVAKAICARHTVGKYPKPTKPPPVNPYDT
jgi:hypothetical protein